MFKHDDNYPHQTDKTDIKYLHKHNVKQGLTLNLLIKKNGRQSIGVNYPDFVTSWCDNYHRQKYFKKNLMILFCEFYSKVEFTESFFLPFLSRTYFYTKKGFCLFMPKLQSIVKFYSWLYKNIIQLTPKITFFRKFSVVRKKRFLRQKQAVISLTILLFLFYFYVPVFFQDGVFLFFKFKGKCTIQ